MKNRILWSWEIFQRLSFKLHIFIEYIASFRYVFLKHGKYFLLFFPKINKVGMTKEEVIFLRPNILRKPRFTIAVSNSRGRELNAAQ